MINWINDNMDRHIITIEDPIEYFHKHKKSLVNQREIGIDVPDFPEAIRRALRMDPDIILVGEMRDLATIQAAITAAETGHIVFGTLHTNSAEGTVNRIIDVFPKEQQDQIRTQLSVAIIGILAQALLPRKPKGLVAAYEMLVVTPAISNLIRENKTYRIDSSIQTGRKHGMILLDDSLFNLWRQGLVEEEEVIFKSPQAGRPPGADRERQEGDLRRRAKRRKRKRTSRRSELAGGCGAWAVTARPVSPGVVSTVGRTRLVPTRRVASPVDAVTVPLAPRPSWPGPLRSISSRIDSIRATDRGSATAPGPERVGRHGTPTRHDPGGHGLPRRGAASGRSSRSRSAPTASCSARWPSGWAWSRRTRCSRRSASSSG